MWGNRTPIAGGFGGGVGSDQTDVDGIVPLITAVESRFHENASFV